MTTALRTATAVTLLLAFAGLVVPGDQGRMVALSMVAVVIAAPLVRVAWLAVAWWREGDRRFVLAAAALLLVAALGPVLAALGTA